MKTLLIAAGMIVGVQLANAQCSSPCIAHTAGTGANTFTTSTITGSVTGATLFVVNVGYYGATTTNPGTVSDGCTANPSGNTWTALPTANNSSRNVGQQFLYVISPNLTCGANEAVTLTGSSIFSSIEFAAFTGTGTFNTQGAAVESDGTAASWLIGPVTSVSGGLVITGLADSNINTYTIDSSFSITDQFPYSGGNYVGSAFAYVVASGTSTSATWTASFLSFGPIQIASFNLPGATPLGTITAGPAGHAGPTIFQ